MSPREAVPFENGADRTECHEEDGNDDREEGVGDARELAVRGTKVVVGLLQHSIIGDLIVLVGADPLADVEGIEVGHGERRDGDKKTQADDN